MCPLIRRVRAGQLIEYGPGMSRHPPERIDLGDLVLRRERVGDEALLVPVLQADLDHLRPWMPWATPDNATAASQRARLVEVEKRWDAAEDHGFLVLDAAQECVLGVFGLHRRTGPGGASRPDRRPASASRRARSP